MAGHKLQRTAASTASDQEILNYDHLTEVFSYLPAKNLFRLRIVSKSLNNMITSDPLFQLMQSNRNTAAAAILVGSDYSPLQLCLLDPDAGFPRDSLDILPRNKDGWILCSAGGLIFYLKKYTTFYSICAYNPVCHDSWFIRIPPDVGTWYSSLAVEFTNDDGDSVTGNYKLVYLTPDQKWPKLPNLYRCRVYDSATQDWTRDEMIDHGPSNLDFKNPAVHQGIVFWASDCFDWDSTTDPYVMSYEIATGAIEFLAMPEPDDGAVELGVDIISVGVWEESWLCLVHYRRRSGTFTVWRWATPTTTAAVAADHHHHQYSWVKLNDEFVFDNLEKAACVWSMLVCNGGKEKGMVLVFDVKDEAYVYSFRKRDLTRLTMSSGSYCLYFMEYANTLRPACGRSIKELSRSD